MPLEHRAAFFDVDNTLLNLKSMFSFQEYFYANAPAAWRGPLRSYGDFLEQLDTHPDRQDRLALNGLFYESFKGRRAVDVTALAEQWFSRLSAEHGDRLWIRSALNLASTLRDDGCLLVAVSGSCHEILAPVMKHLSFDRCLATTLEMDKDIYTGKIVPPQIIGSGKAQVILQLAQSLSLNLDHCAACGDHITDMPMLESVGMPYIVAGDPMLEQVAASRRWPVLDAVAPIQKSSFVHI